MVPSTHKKDTPVTTSGIDAHHTSGATLRSLTGTPHATHSQPEDWKFNPNNKVPLQPVELLRSLVHFSKFINTVFDSILFFCAIPAPQRSVTTFLLVKAKKKGIRLESKRSFFSKNDLSSLMKLIVSSPGQPGRKGKTERQSPEGYVRYTGPSQSAHKEERKGAATAQQIIVGFGDTTIRKKAALPRNNRSIEKAARNTDTTKEREADKGRIPTTINQ
ncbi:unnamed protein product, partial [Brassica rapa subsp. narinosa]